MILSLAFVCSSIKLVRIECSFLWLLSIEWKVGHLLLKNWAIWLWFHFIYLSLIVLIVFMDKITRECLLSFYLLLVLTEIVNMRNLPKVFVVSLLLKINAFYCTIYISKVIYFLLVNKSALWRLFTELFHI